MEQLTEISNHFTIEYQKYQDTGSVYWTVKLLGEKPQVGEGGTLQGAINNLHQNQDLKDFETSLHKARIGVKCVEDWKTNIRSIL
jgi:hypothetical protein